MTISQTKQTPGIARHLPASNDVEEIRRVLNHVYNAIQNNVASTTTIVKAQTTTPSGGFSLTTPSSGNGWWTGITPPFAFLATDSSGNLVLDSDGCATIVKVV